MNAFSEWIRRVFQTRPLALVIATTVALAIVVLFAAPTAVMAQGPTSCFKQMAEGAQPQVITFASVTYTVTIPAGTDACLESKANLLLGFVSTSPFAVDGNGASAVPAPGTGFLYAQGPVSGTLTYDLTASEVDMVLTDVNASGETVLVWLGALKSAPAASVTPTPVASATNLVLYGPGLLPRLPATAPNPQWDVRPVAGSDPLVLKIQAGVVFTPTTAINGAYPVAVSCGTDCFEATLPTNEGRITAPQLRGWWWTATLVGPEKARVLMPAPVKPVSPAAPSDDQKTGGGAATGAAPNLWGATSAPRPIWLPLLIRPSR